MFAQLVFIQLYLFVNEEKHAVGSLDSLHD
jgi:hypothetical protein